MGDILRRRQLMLQGEGTPTGELLLVGASYGGRIQNGSLTQLGGGDFTIQSTGGANWRLYANPYGDAQYFKTFAQLKGHTVRIYYTKETTSIVSGASIAVCLMLASNLTQTASRTKYKSWNVQNDADGRNYRELVIPTSIDAWPQTERSGSDTNYFNWRIYLYSASGSKITFTDIAVYDYGIL